MSIPGEVTIKQDEEGQVIEILVRIIPNPDNPLNRSEQREILQWLAQKSSINAEAVISLNARNGSGGKGTRGRDIQIRTKMPSLSPA